MSGEQGSSGLIVVGVDGSEPSKQALRWSARQAALIGGSVVAVIAWDYQAYYGVPLEYGCDFEGIASCVLAQSIDDALGPERPVVVRTRVIRGNATQVLIEEARDAELLVLGNRGHGGFAELLLGSVGQHCTHHARCPVVIIRGNDN